jgi:2-haloacid dehalogenase
MKNGYIQLDEVLNTRFSETMFKLGKIVDGVEWEKQYRELLGNGHQLIDGALEACQSLSKSHRLFVVTNGLGKTQKKRLKLAGLYGYFEEIFDSESIGFQKPSKEFFNYVMDQITDFKANEALIIGDSLTSDIKGGLMSGIDTCWLNRKSQQCPPDLQSTYMITSLAELNGICSIPKMKV